MITLASKAVRWALTTELIVGSGLAVTGVPHELSLSLASLFLVAHTPGLFVLNRVGLCCGFGGSFLITDVWGGSVQHPRILPVLTLCILNTACLAFMILLYQLVRHRSQLFHTQPPGPAQG